MLEELLSGKHKQRYSRLSLQETNGHINTNTNTNTNDVHSKSSNLTSMTNKLNALAKSLTKDSNIKRNRSNTRHRPSSIEKKVNAQPLQSDSAYANVINEFLQEKKKK